MDPDNDPDPECIKPNDDFFGVDTTLYQHTSDNQKVSWAKTYLY